jgi:hypothetical protein
VRILMFKTLITCVLVLMIGLDAMKSLPSVEIVED